MTKLTITGARDGDSFQMLSPAHRDAAATFVTVRGSEIVVTHRAADFFDMPTDTPVVAHWQGQWHTDGFALTVGRLQALSAAERAQHEATKAANAAHQAGLRAEKKAQKNPA